MWYALGVGKVTHKTERSIGYETDVKDENLVCCVGSCVHQRRGLFGVANLPRVQAEAVSGGVEVTEAPGNEAVVSEESKAEVPEISEILKSPKYLKRRRYLLRKKNLNRILQWMKTGFLQDTENRSHGRRSISIENGDGSFDAENDPYFSASSIYGGKM